MQVSHAALRSSQLALADGVANRPALRFRSEPTSGLRRLSAGKLGLDILGVTRAEVNAAGLIVTGSMQAASLAVGAVATSTFAGALTVTGLLTANNGLTVSGAVLTANNGLTVNGLLTANNGLTLTGVLTMGTATLSAAGSVLTLTGNAIISGGLNIQLGTLTVATGNSQVANLTVNGTLSVTGLATASGGLTVGTGVASQLNAPAPFLGIYDGAGGARAIKVGSLTVASNYATTAAANSILATGSITANGVGSFAGLSSSNGLTVTSGGLVVQLGGLSVTGTITMTGAMTVSNGITISGGGLAVTGSLMMGVTSPIIPSAVSGVPAASALHSNNVPKAWGYVQGNGVVSSGYGASVSRFGVGSYQITFQRAFASGVYCVLVTSAVTGYVGSGGPAGTSTANVFVNALSGGAFADVAFNFVAFGDQ